MEIKILGNGGGTNKGLKYNSFIINKKYLCELPPDIMYTLNKNKINIYKIETIFISHLHGDHIFGIPFLILELFYYSTNNNNKNINIKIFGPKNTKKHTEQLLALSFSKNHPSINWIDKNITFIEINEKSIISFIPDYNIKYFKLNHPINTYGFALYNNKNEILLSYMPDTLWDSEIKKILEKKPKAVIIDLNGQKNEKKKVHLSIDDLKEFALPITMVGNDKNI